MGRMNRGGRLEYGRTNLRIVPLTPRKLRNLKNNLSSSKRNPMSSHLSLHCLTIIEEPMLAVRRLIESGKNLVHWLLPLYPQYPVGYFFKLFILVVLFTGPPVLSGAALSDKVNNCRRSRVPGPLAYRRLLCLAALRWPRRLIVLPITRVEIIDVERRRLL